jgi:hypothetical protein
MKVCGFTIIRNAIKFGYPIVESITSILPVCDKMVVAVGKSDDDTLNLIKSINSDKIIIIETIWDDSLKEGGRVMAEETNKAMDAITDDFDWCFYIQADEVVHEKYHEIIRREMERWINEPRVQGLLFKYLHFWGTFDYIGITRTWYKHEIRIIRNDKKIRSFRDAQGFWREKRKLNVKLIDAYIYHYGWVRPPEIIKEKMSSFHALYQTGKELEAEIRKVSNFDYSEIDAVKKFDGTHPKVMEKLINSLNWHVQLDAHITKHKPKDFILFHFERITNYRLFEYKNYKIV